VRDIDVYNPDTLAQVGTLKRALEQMLRLTPSLYFLPRRATFWGEGLTGYPAEAFAPDRWEALERQGRSDKEVLHFGFGYGPRVRFNRH
jgi:cytochrome P450